MNKHQFRHVFNIKFFNFKKIQITRIIQYMKYYNIVWSIVLNNKIYQFTVGKVVNNVYIIIMYNNSLYNYNNINIAH